MTRAESNRRYEQRHPDRVRARRQRYREANKDLLREKRFLYNCMVKRKAMDMYGGGCAACGTTELAVLTIDHKNDDGKELRASGKDFSGNRFYFKLLREPRRDDLQVLCFNCQHRKLWHGGDFGRWPSSDVCTLRQKWRRLTRPA